MINNPRKRKRLGWDYQDEDITDPDDSWQADCGVGVGSVGFTEYDQPDAADPVKKPRRADRVRMGFHAPTNAYEDD